MTEGALGKAVPLLVAVMGKGDPIGSADIVRGVVPVPDLRPLADIAQDSGDAFRRDGRADVSYVRLPVDRTRLSIVPLFTEPRGAVMPTGHRLADKQEIHLADLADDTLLQPYDLVPEWRTLVGDARMRALPATLTVEEKLEHIAAGQGASCCRSPPRGSIGARTSCMSPSATSALTRWCWPGTWLVTVP